MPEETPVLIPICVLIPTCVKTNLEGVFGFPGQWQSGHGSGAVIVLLAQVVVLLVLPRAFSLEE